MGRDLVLMGQVGVGCCAILKVQSYHGATAAHLLVASSLGTSRETANLFHALLQSMRAHGPQLRPHPSSQV